MICNSVYLQNTYSKIIEFENTELDALSHIRLLDDELIVFGFHHCSVGNGPSTICNSISEVSFSGEQLSEQLIEDFETNIGSLSVINNDSMLILGFERNLNLATISLLDYNLNTSEFDIFNLGISNDKRFFPEGILELNNSYYIHGHYDDLSPGIRIRGFVQKWNTDFTEQLTSWTYGHNEFLTISDMRITKDSNLIFSLYQSQVGPSSIENIQIMQIDTFGSVLSNFKIERQSPSNDRVQLDINVDEGVYIQNDVSRESFIVKLSQGLDSVLWDQALPTDFYPLDRNYDIREISLLENGDVLVCGGLNYIHLESGRINSGFITRIGKEGEIKWNKILTNEIPLGNTSNVEFSNSFLYDIVELPNGNIVAVGEIVSEVYELGLASKAWIISIDENGCMEGFNCADDIYILNTGGSLPFPTSLNETLPVLDVSIFPNPVQDFLKFSAEGDIEYTIFDINGQVISKGESDKEINVQELSSGIYFLQIVQNGQLYQAQKFVKL